jgi:N-acetylmuramoyl-L-alanine amidase
VIHTICLDPGHGGKDPGEKVGSTLEKTYTLLLARELACRMRAAGLLVFLTRGTDTFVGLDDRPALANRTGSDLFISLHFNAAPGGECRGVEVYCLTPATARSTNIAGQEADQTSLPGNRLDAGNVLLAYDLQRSLVGSPGVEDRGVRRARFAVLRSARMPAVLIEGGFLSNSAERRNLTNPEYRGRMAEAILQGVLAFKLAVEP